MNIFKTELTLFFHLLIQIILFFRLNLEIMAHSPNPHRCSASRSSSHLLYPGAKASATFRNKYLYGNELDKLKRIERVFRVITTPTFSNFNLIVST